MTINWLHFAIGAVAGIFAGPILGFRLRDWQWWAILVFVAIVVAVQKQFG